MSRLLRALVVPSMGLLAFACGDEGISDPEPIQVQDLIGDYVATEFLAEVDGEMVDMLAAGSEITLALAADGRTSGQLIIPPPFGEDDAGQVADLAGFFLFDEENATVELTHPGGHLPARPPVLGREGRVWRDRAAGQRVVRGGHRGRAHPAVRFLLFHSVPGRIQCGRLFRPRG